MPLDQCLECGFEFGDRRALTVARFDDFPARLGEMLEAADEGMLRSRPSAGVWSPIEYTAHLGEALGWYVARVRRVLYEEAPQPVDRRHPPTTAGNEQRRNHAGDDMLILQEACRLLRVPEGTLRHWHADLVIWLTEQTKSDRGR